MSEEHQPEAVWVFPAKKSNKGRIWLIVILAVLAVVIVGVLLFFLLPRDGEPEPKPSPTDSTTVAPSPSPTAPPTDMPAEDSGQTQPPVPDPDIHTFAGQVQPWLDDAATGLGFVADMSGQEAAQVVDSLQQDAERLSDAAAPDEIATEWQSAVSQYAARLDTLRTVVESGSAPQPAIDAATAALHGMRSLVGL